MQLRMYVHIIQKALDYYTTAHGYPFVTFSTTSASADTLYHVSSHSFHFAINVHMYVVPDCVSLPAYVHLHL